MAEAASSPSSSSSSSSSSSKNHREGTSTSSSSSCSKASSVRSSRDSAQIKFNSKEYKDDVFQMLSMMKRHHILTDVKLEVDKEIYNAHKIVLAAASPYFRAMFTGGLRECEMNTVKLQGVCPVVMSHLLRFMYTGEIVLNERLVCPLLSLATMLQMSHIIEACCSFLQTQMDPTNVIGIANFVQQHGCIEFYNKINVFIEQHFAEVCMEEEFLQLSDRQLVNLIKRDELNVTDEKDVYCAVLKWVMYDEEKRQPIMEDILRTVRCQYLSPQFISEQMKNCNLLRKVPACKEYLAKIFKELSLHQPHRQKERTPNAPCVIYIVGGYSYNRQHLDTLECYDVDKCRWTQLSKLPVARSGLGAAYLSGIFYAVGGRNILPEGNFHDSNWVDSFDPISNTWQQKTPMKHARNRLGIAVLDGQLYAVGGVNGGQYFDSVERFDPEDNKWTSIKLMSKARMGVGVAVVNRLLYAIGGFDGHERLKSVESYHPERNQWTFVAPMNTARSGAGICCVSNFIFVIGGYDGSHQLNSVEKYNTTTDTWTNAPPLKRCRSAMTVSVWDSKIFVMGGYDGSTFLSSVEVFDFKEESWTEGKSLPWGRSGHASASSCQSYMCHAN